LVKCSLKYHILERHASHTRQFAWQFYFWSKQCVYLHRPRTLIGLSLSTIHQPLLSPSCNWFFVFQALRCPRNPNFSFFTPPLRRASVIRARDSSMVRYPRNLAIAFRLISRFVTEGCTENGGRLWYLCKQVGAMRIGTTFICFRYSDPSSSLRV